MKKWLYITLFALVCTIKLNAAPLYSMEFTVTGYAGSTALTDFPVAVRLSEAISGFSYSSFVLPNGGDITFETVDGEELFYEVDTWNEQGESLIYVKLPTMNNNVRFTMYYGDTSAVAKSTSFINNVWSRYAAVWHMGSQTTDSTGHGFEVAKIGGYVVNSEVGVSGECMMSPTTQGKNSVRLGNYMPYLTDVAKQTVSMWLYPTSSTVGVSSTVRAFSNKSDSGNVGVELILVKGQIYARGNSGSQQVMTDRFVGRYLNPNTWTHLTATYNDASGAVYANGSLDKAGTIAKVISTGVKSTSVGNFGGGSETTQSFVGAIDEVRVFDGVASTEWIKAEYDTINNAQFLTYSDASAIDQTAIVFEEISFEYGADNSITLKSNLRRGTGAVYAVIDGVTTNKISDVEVGDSSITLSYVLPTLDANTSHFIKLVGESTTGAFTERNATTVVYTGEISITKIADAMEEGLVPGSFKISRADTVGDLYLDYIVGGTAVADEEYESLSGSVVIADGESEVIVNVLPLNKPSTQTDVDVVVSLKEGNCFINPSASAATITIYNQGFLAGYNTWCASSGNNLASNPNNWSEGRLPVSTDNILLDANYSNVAMVWDGGVDGLTTEVASWTQNENYTGTVTFNTTFEDVDTTFTMFRVNGDCVINGGTWTHKSHEATVTSGKYRLALTVGGSLTVGANALINVSEKGLAKQKAPLSAAYGLHAGSRTDISLVSGSVTEPILVGNGGDSLSGGGAVWISASGSVTIDGSVLAISGLLVNNDGWSNKGAGAGGSIYIKGASISGSGKISAQSTKFERNGISPSGGRVALIATTANEIGIPKANISATSSIGTVSTGAGTIFLKTAGQTYGTLYIKNTIRPVHQVCEDRPRTYKAVTPIPSGETWTFDSIILEDQGILGIPEGTTLVLPNGFASVSGNAKLSENINVSHGGIMYLGGTIEASDINNAVIQNNWVFHAKEPFTFPGDVTIKDGAAIGTMYLRNLVEDFASCNVRVDGNLTVESTGYVYAKSGGIVQKENGINAAANYFGTSKPFAHGGALAMFAGTNVAYGSIFNPVLPGTFGGGNDSAALSLGGGLVSLNIGGTLTVDGKIDATPTGSEWNACEAGSGGALNIICSELLGTGSIKADGISNKLKTDVAITGSGRSACGAGGRISIRLTSPMADFDTFGVNKISAQGFSNIAYPAISRFYSGAGTIYLQKANDGEGKGTIYVRNDGEPTNIGETAIPASSFGDEATAFAKRPNIDMSNGARVLAGLDNLRFGEIRMEEGCKLNLDGKTWYVTNMLVGDNYVGMGEVSALDLPDYLIDTSESATGKIIVTGAATCIIIK